MEKTQNDENMISKSQRFSAARSHTATENRHPDFETKSAGLPDVCFYLSVQGY
jgi:hypothetical protein